MTADTMTPVPIIQEELSRAYVHAICARAGWLFEEPRRDNGIDLLIGPLYRREKAYRDYGARLGIQAKATTQLRGTAKQLVHDLEAKNYNDLCMPSGAPRILIVLAMPPQPADWLAVSTRQLVLRSCAYWLSLQGVPPTINSRTCAVAIPRVQRFDQAALAGPLLKLATERRLP